MCFVLLRPCVVVSQFVFEQFQDKLAIPAGCSGVKVDVVIDHGMYEELFAKGSKFDQVREASRMPWVLPDMVD